MERQIDKRRDDLKVVVEFGNIPDQDLEDEISTLLKLKHETEERNNKKMSKLLNRHDSSVKNTYLRRDRIINTAEDIACDVLHLSNW